MEHQVTDAAQRCATSESLFFARLVALLDQVAILVDGFAVAPYRFSIPADGVSDLAATSAGRPRRLTDDRQTLAMLAPALEHPTHNAATRS